MKLPHVFHWYRKTDLFFEQKVLDYGGDPVRTHTMNLYADYYIKTCKKCGKTKRVAQRIYWGREVLQNISSDLKAIKIVDKIDLLS